MEVSAGTGTFAEEFVSETALWHWPENMIRHEAGAEPGNLRILRVRGNSMEPELRDGDRIVVDVWRRLLATSGKHLQRYVDEFSGRHNIRDMGTLDQMDRIARGLVGKRLKYQELVGG